MSNGFGIAAERSREGYEIAGKRTKEGLDFAAERTKYGAGVVYDGVSDGASLVKDKLDETGITDGAKIVGGYAYSTGAAGVSMLNAKIESNENLASYKSAAAKKA